MDLVLAKKIIKKVQNDYNLIAKEWEESRVVPRPFQATLAKNIKKGDRVLDAGCGNGVLYAALASKSIDYTGLDGSVRLLQIAKKRASELKRNQKLNSSNVKFVKGNIVKMPFTENYFDWVLALAVLHHLPAGEYQEKAAREMYRVLKPGGHLALSVWNLYSEYARKKFQIDEQLKKLPVGWGEKDFSAPWKATPRRAVNRYLYRFEKKELADLFQKAGFKKVQVKLADASGRWTADVNRGCNFVLMVKK